MIPAHRRLADIETTLVRELRRETFLRRALRGQTDGYDIVLIDCPPNLGLLTVNALCAADEAIVPIDMKSVDALAGAEELIATAAALEEDGPKITALLRNRVEGTVAHRRQVYTAIDDAIADLGVPVARTLIPARDDFEKAAILQTPLVLWRPDHAGSLAFRSLADELDQLAA